MLHRQVACQCEAALPNHSFRCDSLAGARRTPQNKQHAHAACGVPKRWPSSIQKTRRSAEPFGARSESWQGICKQVDARRIEGEHRRWLSLRLIGGRLSRRGAEFGRRRRRRLRADASSSRRPCGLFRRAFGHRRVGRGDATSARPRPQSLRTVRDLCQRSRPRRSRTIADFRATGDLRSGAASTRVVRADVGRADPGVGDRHSARHAGGVATRRLDRRPVQPRLDARPGDADVLSRLAAGLRLLLSAGLGARAARPARQHAFAASAGRPDSGRSTRRSPATSRCWGRCSANWRCRSSRSALFGVGPIARMTRASLLEVLKSDYVRTARAAGLPGRQVLWTYAFRNALVPVLNTVGMVFSFLLGANVLVEKVFGWPGVGAYAIDALLASDFAPVQGFVDRHGVLLPGGQPGDRHSHRRHRSSRGVRCLELVA